MLITAAYVPETRMKARVGHPMVAGVQAWAFAHLLSNGTLADVVLFGSFLVWAVFSYRAALRRDIAANAAYAIGPMSRDITAVAIGAIAWAVFAFWLHEWLIGVRPLF